ncbi:MAG: epimerase [Pseudomonas fluorescens]|nr:MAG: epimerase [Pseudomonas fluorescens]
MRVLVTGANGFIGKHLLRVLLKHPECEVWGMVRTAGSLSEFENVREVVHDVADAGEGLFEALGQPDVVVHLAWGELSNFKSAVHVEQLLPVHTAFVDALHAQGLKRFIGIGTCLEYGLQEGALREDMECFPVTAYGEAKLRMGRHVLELERWSAAWLRLFYMMGEGQAAKSIIPQLDAALAREDEVFNMSGGEQLRDYLDVTVVARLIAWCVLDGYEGLINIGWGKPVSVKSLVAARIRDKGGNIELNLGYYPYPDYEPMAFWADTTKLRALLREPLEAA